MSSVPGLGRFPGGGNGNPLQFSFLENSSGGGAWQATVHGVAESDMTEQPSTVALKALMTGRQRALLVLQCLPFIVICLLFAPSPHSLSHSVHPTSCSFLFLYLWFKFPRRNLRGRPNTSCLGRRFTPVFQGLLVNTKIGSLYKVLAGAPESRAVSLRSGLCGWAPGCGG